MEKGDRELVKPRLTFLPRHLFIGWLMSSAATVVMPSSQDLPRHFILHTRQYLDLLQAADSTTFRHDFEIEFLLLLNPPQRQIYDSLQSLAEKKSFLQLYWNANNPNPLQPENERLLMHLQRRAYARENFPSAAPPYFDARGKYYLKYGRPALRFEDPGGQKRVAFFSPDMYPFVQRMYSFKGAPEQYYTVQANESWSYQNVARDFLVHFMKDGPGFREIESLSAALTSHQRKNVAWGWSDLVKQRAAVAPLLGRATQQIEQFESSLTYMLNVRRGGGPGLLREDTQSLNERLIAVENTHREELNKARRDLPAVALEPLDPARRLDFHDVITQFRGPGGRTRIDLTLLAPLENNLLGGRDTARVEELTIEFAWMLRDQNFDSLAAQRKIQALPIKFYANENLPNALGRFTFLAQPQQAELCLQVHDSRRHKSGAYKKPLAVRDFSGRALLLSDVQLLMEVRTEQQSLALPIIEKQNLLLAPYPYRKIRKSQPLFCYFEIYNLRAAGITESYEITYKIISSSAPQNFLTKLSRWLMNGQEAAVSLSHVQRVVDDTTQELLAIDLSKIANGAQRLEITVTSAKDDQIKASVTREIVIDE